MLNTTLKRLKNITPFIEVVIIVIMSHGTIKTTGLSKRGVNRTNYF